MEPVPSAGSKPQEVEGNGSWPNPSLQRAFVEGMKWWQFHHNGATAFPSERDEAENEAVRRFGQPVADGGGLPPETAEQAWERAMKVAERASGYNYDLNYLFPYKPPVSPEGSSR